MTSTRAVSGANNYRSQGRKSKDQPFLPEKFGALTWHLLQQLKENTMNQSELIMTIAQVSGESRKTVEHVLKTAADVMTNALVEGAEVVLPGIGKLHVTHTDARQGRNPATGEAIAIPARVSAKFKAGSALKDALNA